MQLIKNIFGRVYALYALLLFVISMLVVVIPVRMNMRIKDDRKRTAAILTILRRWMAFYLPAIFCPVRKKGLECFKKDQNYVVVFNHNSLMDVPVSSPSVPGANKTLAKAEIAKTPVFGMIYKC
ncbi:MAG TPA: 1-acyl-sn-glycerol-3-phosphate acyltransferase, partial [Chitinophagaceae bacterium]